MASGSGLAPYRAFLAWPGVAPVAACAYASRLTSGMLGLSVLLLVQARTGWFAEAGTAVALQGLCVAAASPVHGWLIDRAGAARVLAACALACPAALLLLALAADRGAGPGPVLAAAAVSGLCVPQVATAVRSLWSAWLPDGPVRQAAFAVESISGSVAFVVGPGLVGAVALALAPEDAVAATAAMAAAGAVAVALASRGLRATPPDGSPAPARRGRLAGALAAPGLVPLLLAAMLGSGIFGILPVAITAFVRDLGEPEGSAGLLLSLMSAGSVAGGLATGAARWAAAPLRPYAPALAVLAAGVAVLGAATSLPELAGLLLLAGALTAVVETLELRLVAALVPGRAAGEAFGWFNAAIYLGFAVSSAAAGFTVDRFGTRAACVAAGGCALLAAACGLAVARQAASPSR